MEQTKRVYTINYKQRVINKILKGELVRRTTLDEYQITILDLDIGNIRINEKVKFDIISISRNRGIELPKSEYDKQNTILQEENRKLIEDVKKLKEQCKSFMITNKAYESMLVKNNIDISTGNARTY